MKLLLGLLIASVVLYLIYNRNQLENFREFTKEEICHQDHRLLVVDPPNIPVAPEKYYAVTQDKENIHYPTTLNPASNKAARLDTAKSGVPMNTMRKSLFMRQRYKMQLYWISNWISPCQLLNPSCKSTVLEIPISFNSATILPLRTPPPQYT